MVFFFFFCPADSCSFKIEKEYLKVSELFPRINSEKTALGILDWGVKMTTLEDGEGNNYCYLASVN